MKDRSRTFLARTLFRLHGELDRVRRPVTVRHKGEKRALLSYIVHPFRPNSPLTHCNIIESIQIADVLHGLGYQVDVVDYRNTRTINYNRYDLLIGFGLPFSRSFELGTCGATRINYLTGANPSFSNLAEAKRIAALRSRKGQSVRARREVYHPWTNAAVNADGLIVTGNAWTASTYADINPHVYTVPVPYTSIPSLPTSDHVGRGFVWFGGTGAVHKGLDLILDALTADGGQYDLDVCGPVQREDDFYRLYVDELTKRPNIRYWGTIDPRGNVMDEISRRNSFVLLPSCSEGGASSVITCMARGLLPIVTHESAIDLKAFGVRITDGSVQSVLHAMQCAQAMSDETIQGQRTAIMNYVRGNHSPIAYATCFRAAVIEILGKGIA